MPSHSYGCNQWFTTIKCTYLLTGVENKTWCFVFHSNRQLPRAFFCLEYILFLLRLYISHQSNHLRNICKLYFHRFLFNHIYCQRCWYALIRNQYYVQWLFAPSGSIQDTQIHSQCKDEHVFYESASYKLINIILSSPHHDLIHVRTQPWFQYSITYKVQNTVLFLNQLGR